MADRAWVDATRVRRADEHRQPTENRVVVLSSRKVAWKQKETGDCSDYYNTKGLLPWQRLDSRRIKEKTAVRMDSFKFTIS